MALFMMRVATTLLSPQEMGRVSLVSTTTAFFALFLINPVGMFINRRLHAWQTNRTARHYLILYADYLLMVSLAAIIVLTLLYTKGLVHFGIPIGWMIFLVFGSLLFNTINQTAIPSINLLGDSTRFVLLSLATISTSFACAALLTKLLHPLAQYWLLGIILGQAFLGTIGVRVLFEKLQDPKTPSTSSPIRKEHLTSLFHFAWPVAIAAGLGWVQGQGYRYLIESRLSLADLGLFVAGYSISMGMMTGFESILTTYFQPRLYREVNKSPGIAQGQAWQRYAAAVIPSLLLTVGFIIVLAPELAHTLLGKNFQAAGNFIVWGALAEAARVLTGVYSLIAHVHMKTRWLILPNLIGATLSICLCILFIPLMGAAGAGLGLALSGFAVLLTMHLLLARHVGGGVSILPLFLAVLSAAIFWGMSLVLRHLLKSTGTGLSAAVVLVFLGTTYVGFQYLFLQRHLMEKKSA